MFALHCKVRSVAARFCFGIGVVVCALIFGIASHTAKAQVRFGIGIGGAIGGALLEESRRQNSQQNEQYHRSHGATESSSPRKTTKAKNQKPKRDDSKIAKDSPPKAKTPEPVASAPQTTPLTAGPPPTSDKFGD